MCIGGEEERVTASPVRRVMAFVGAWADGRYLENVQARVTLCLSRRCGKCPPPQ
jgi:hypothetical protein